jgi:hypothetical protein
MTGLLHFPFEVIEPFSYISLRGVRQSTGNPLHWHWCDNKHLPLSAW